MKSLLDMDALRMVRRLGLPGCTALALLAWVTWLNVISVPAAELTIADIRASTQRELGRGAAVRHASAPGEAALAAVYARLPSDRMSNTTLATVLASARKKDLSVDAVQFHTESSQLPGVTRHEIDLPLRGRYVDVRQWLAQTLEAQPEMAVDTLDIRRKDSATGVVEVHVSLSLWAVVSEGARLP